jgi:hypothetical protein
VVLLLQQLNVIANLIAVDKLTAITAVMNMHGYDQRGVGIKMKDTALKPLVVEVLTRNG